MEWRWDHLKWDLHIKLVSAWKCCWGLCFFTTHNTGKSAGVGIVLQQKWHFADAACFTQGISMSYKLARSLLFADTNCICNRHIYIKLLEDDCAGRVSVEMVTRSWRVKKHTPESSYDSWCLCEISTSAVFWITLCWHLVLCIQTQLVPLVSQCSWHENLLVSYEVSWGTCSSEFVSEGSLLDILQLSPSSP